jgi:hypothetical protein
MTRLLLLNLCLLALTACKSECKKMDTSYVCLLSNEGNVKYANGTGDTLVYIRETDVTECLTGPSRKMVVEVRYVNLKVNGFEYVQSSIQQEGIYFSLNGGNSFTVRMNGVSSANCAFDNPVVTGDFILRNTGDTIIDGVSFYNALHLQPNDGDSSRTISDIWIEGERGIIQYRKKTGETFHRIKP